jgi:hypothetical protein
MSPKYFISFIIILVILVFPYLSDAKNQKDIHITTTDCKGLKELEKKGENAD